MARHVYAVFTNPVEGREDDYNDWYDNRHLDDVMAAAGFTTSRRLRLSATNPAQRSPHRYLALYEIDTDDIDAVNAALLSAAGTDALPLSDALDLTSLSGGYYEVITERHRQA